MNDLRRLSLQHRLLSNLAVVNNPQSRQQAKLIADWRSVEEVLPNLRNALQFRKD